MRTTVRRFVIVCVIGLTSCSSGGGAESTSTTSTTTAALPTTTTIDALALKEQAKSELLKELFRNTEMTYIHSNGFFATIEELQTVLREFGIFGDIRAEPAAMAAFSVSKQLQRELCDDWLLEDVIAQLEPTNTVGSNFDWDNDKADMLTDDAVLARGGMNIFQVPSAEKLRNLEGLFSDNFAARGGECSANSKFYGAVADEGKFIDNWSDTLTTQWWTEQQLLDLTFPLKGRALEFYSRFGKQDSDLGLGFRVVQAASGDNYIRNFSLIPFPELGLLVVTEVNIYMNATSSGSMTRVEFAETYAPAFSKLQTEMFKGIFGYILAKGL